MWRTSFCYPGVSKRRTWDAIETIVGAFMLNSRLKFEDHCHVFLRLLREHREAAGAELKGRTYVRLVA